MSTTARPILATRPLLPNRPRLRFVDDAPDGSQSTVVTPATGAPATLEEALTALAEARAETEKWKGHSRDWETKSKANAEKAKKFDEAEDANKTELERERTAREVAEAELAKRDKATEAVTLRDQIAKDKGFAERNVPVTALRGDTREELEAHADELLALVPAPAVTTTTDGQGETTTIGDGEMSAQDVVAAATSR
jgi:hypothetical protein